MRISFQPLGWGAIHWCTLSDRILYIVAKLGKMWGWKKGHINSCNFEMEKPQMSGYLIPLQCKAHQNTWKIHFPWYSRVNRHTNYFECLISQRNLELNFIPAAETFGWLLYPIVHWDIWGPLWPVIVISTVAGVGRYFDTPSNPVHCFVYRSGVR